MPCASEEDRGRSSKSNSGQVNLVSHIISLLRSPRSEDADENLQHSTRLQSFTIALLTPYSRQVALLKQDIRLDQNTSVSTIDGFQGRESDLVIVSTVRSNLEGDLGFVDDARRLNVAWTRPRLGLIIVGDDSTLNRNPMWQRALNACRQVPVQMPEIAEQEG